MRVTGAAWRRIAVLTVIGAFASGAVMAWSRTAPTPFADPLGPEQAASRLAKTIGRRVVVAERTTETTQVVADPDGTFTLLSDLRPVRAKVDGEWLPIDLTLETKSDGRIGPRVAPFDVRLSNGGGGLFAEMVVDDKTFRVAWQGSLPRPTLNGPKATYAEVFAGVDLVVTMDQEGFREVLVVKTAQALAALKATQVRFGFAADDLTLTQAGPGRAAVRGPAGNDELKELSAEWWDSRFDPQIGGPPSVDVPGGSISRPLTMNVEPGGPASAPGTSVLALPLTEAETSGNVTFPLFIDPALVKPRSHWLTITSANVRYYDDLNDPMRVGYCAFPDCGGTWTARSYFAFVTTDITSKPTTANVVYAFVYATQIHSATCTSLPVDLYSANAFTNTTSWPGPIVAKLDGKSSAAGATCPTPSEVLKFDTPALDTYLQTSADTDKTVTTFALRAPNETNASYWKKFAPSELRLEVKYNFPPNRATGLAVQNAMTCGGVTYSRGTTPRLIATATDNNVSPHDLRFAFSVATAAAPATVVTSGEAWFVPSGGIGGWDVPANKLSAGTSYVFKVKVYNLPGDSTSLASADPDPTFSFTVPSVQPASAPAVTWVAASKTFQFTNPAAEGVTGYTYAWSDVPRSATQVCPTAASTWVGGTTGSGGGVAIVASGVGSAQVPTNLKGPVTVNVRAFNAAGNLSPMASYSVFVPVA